VSEVPTLYEWAGGRAAIERMIGCFYDRVERDDLISPMFPGGVSVAHREHVTTWWCEVFGGPAGYTERLGGYPAMLAHHRDGIGLAPLAQPLRAARLDRLNVSLDTLSPEVFKRLARRDRLADVLAGLAAAAAAGLAPVKVNTVLMRGVNDHEAPDLLAFCLAHGYQLRFIEQMPLDAQHGWKRSQMVTADEILAALSRH
jgi:truncated hemoglobin YjbI